MKTLTSIFLALVVSICIKSNAQQVINTANTAKVLCIKKDGDYHWLGTTGGLARFSTVDNSIEYFNQDRYAGPIYDIELDASGNIWFWTTAGLVKFDGVNWEVVNSFAPGSGLNTANNLVKSVLIEESTGYVWLGTANGVSVYTGNSWIHYDRLNTPAFRFDNVQAIAIDPLTNEKWIGSAFGGPNGIEGALYKFDGSTWIEYTTGTTPNLASNHILEIEFALNGGMWVGTNKGITARSNSQWNTYHLDFPPGGPLSGSKYDYINTICIDPNSQEVYVDSRTGEHFDAQPWDKGGLFKFDGNNWSVISFSGSETALYDVVVLDVVVDEVGDLWVSDNGLARFSSANWEHFATRSSGLTNNEICGLAIDSDNTWVIDKTALQKFDGQNWTNYIQCPIVVNAPSSLKSTLKARSNEVWYGGYNGLAKFNGTTWTNYSSSLPSNHVTAVYLGDEVWIGTDNGLSLFNGSTWVTFNATNSGLPGNYVNDVVKDNSGNKWIATSAGLAKLTGNVWTIYNATNSDLSSNSIRCVGWDPINGQIWGATTNEFFRVDQSMNLTTFSMPNNAANAVAIDNAGNKYFSTLRGLVKFNDQEEVVVMDVISSGITSDLIYSVSINGEQNPVVYYSYGISKLQACNFTPSITTPMPESPACPNPIVLQTNISGAYTYQWLKNGKKIDDSTSEALVVVPGLGPIDYSVIVHHEGCTTISNKVTVPKSTVAPLMLINPYTTVCSTSANNINQVATQGWDNYEWLKDGSPISNNSSQPYQCKTPESGSYAVRATKNGCVVTTPEVNVTVITIDNSLFVPGTLTSFCSNNPDQVIELRANENPGYTYQWSKDAVILPGETNPSYYATSAGAYSLWVTGNGCKRSNSIILGNSTVQKPEITLSCVNQNPREFFKLKSNIIYSNYTYEWFRDDEMIIDENSSLLVLKAPGVYTVEATNSAGCSSLSDPYQAQNSYLPTPILGNSTYLVGQALETLSYDGVAANIVWSANQSLSPQLAMGNTLSLSGLVDTQTTGVYNFYVSQVISNGLQACYTWPANVIVTVERNQQEIEVELTTIAKSYGDSPFNLVASTSSGLPLTYESDNTDIASVLDGEITIHGAGVALITISQPGDNYYLPANPRTIIIDVSKANLFVICEDKTRSYGDDNPELTISFEGFRLGDNELVLTNLPIVSTAANKLADVGEYEIHAAGGTSDNYEFTYVVGKLTVLRSTLEITADNKVKAYGDPNPPLTISYNGFRNDENESALIELPIITTLADNNSPVGEYSLEVTGGLSNNYELNLHHGTLTIAKKNQVITFDEIPELTLDIAGYSLNASASSGLGVEFTSSNPMVAFMEGSYAHLVGEGETTITAKQVGDTNYNAATDVMRTLNVESPIKNSDIILISPNPISTVSTLQMNYKKNQQVELNIVSSDGQFVERRVVSLDNNGIGQLDLQNLVNGVYFITIDGQVIKVVKI